VSFNATVNERIDKELGPNTGLIAALAAGNPALKFSYDHFKAFYDFILGTPFCLPFRLATSSLVNSSPGTWRRGLVRFEKPTSKFSMHPSHIGGTSTSLVAYEGVV
jgi:hypothetical protein